MPVNGNSTPPTPLTVPVVASVATPSGASPSGASAVGMPALNVGSSIAQGSPGVFQGATDATQDLPGAGTTVASGSAAAFATLIGDSAVTDQAAAGAATLAEGVKAPVRFNTPMAFAAVPDAVSREAKASALVSTPVAPAAVPDAVAAGAKASAPSSTAVAAAVAPARIVGGSKGQMSARNAKSPSGVQAKAVSRSPATARSSEIDGDADDTESPASDSVGASGSGLAQASGAASTASSSVDPVSMVAAAARSQDAGTSATSSTDDPSAPVAAAVGGPDGVAGAAGVATSVTLAAARTAAAANTANSSALQALGLNDKHSHNADDSSGAASSVDAALGLPQVNSSAVSAADASPATPTFRIAANVDGSDFSQGLGDRVSWMVSNDLNGAKLQVNPAQLGPIELRISVTGGHAQIWMSTHSGVTRDALEASAPKLREMLGAQGFGQVSVDISQRSFQDRSAYAQPYVAPVSKAAADVSTTSIGASATARSSTGMLDAYA
jgi:flagellar hook-length control protein FliK